MIEFVAIGHLGAGVDLKFGPDALVQLRGLGHDVGEQEGSGIVAVAGIAIAAGAQVPTIETGAGVVPRYGLEKAGGQVGVRHEAIATRHIAQPVRTEVPAHPRGGAPAVVVSQRVLGLVDQVIVRVDHIGRCLAGVAQGEVFRLRGHHGRWCGCGLFFLPATEKSKYQQGGKGCTAKGGCGHGAKMG